VLRLPVPMRGFTLIELLVGLTILGILLMLGMPAFNAMLSNQKLRASAEGVMNGLQSARSEAVKSNVQAQFVLTADDPVPGTVNTLAPSVFGPNWVVRSPDPAAPTTYDFVDGKRGSNASVLVTGSVASVTFNGFGTTTLASTATFQVTNPAGGACATAGGGGGPMRCLNVTVTVGGQVKMCDPVITAAGDTRKC
jgi:type IV fimbrial biogenesis protein FimT